MLNKIWPTFIVIAVIFAILFGNVQELNKAVFESSDTVVQLCITLFGTLTLWNGIMRIAINTKIINFISFILSPVMKFLFPNFKKEDKVYKEISMNVVANFLGLGNAATPLGLRAMQTMQESNNDKSTVSDDMAVFIVLNTASIQLIPTTVIAIRSSLGSINPTMIIFPVWIATICAAVTGVFAVKFFIKLKK